MISLGGGRQKVRFSFALPSLRDSRWYTTGCPSLHKLRAWWNWCWTRFWDVGVQGPPGPCVQAGPGPGISWSWVRGPPSPLSLPSGQSLQPLKEGYQACKLGRIHFTLYNIHFTLYTLHSTPCTIHYTLCTIHYTLYTIHYTLYTKH